MQDDWRNGLGFRIVGSVLFPQGGISSYCSRRSIAVTGVAAIGRVQLCAPEEHFHRFDPARFQAHKSFTWFTMTFAALGTTGLMPCSKSYLLERGWRPGNSRQEEVLSCRN